MSSSASPSARSFSVADFDFQLPDALIAQHPAAERSASRLLDGTGPQPVDRIFRELPGLLKRGDLLVFNDTQVVKARLFGEKASGGKFEILIERVLLPHEAADGSGQEVVAHIRVSKKPQPGGLMHLAGGLQGGGFDAVFLGRWPDEQGQLFRLRLQGPAGETPYELMARHGHVPLPPYITHGDDADDERRYQTVFARVPGAVAAPTAALHFDEGVLSALEAHGVQRASVTLHVGAGTFAPMKTERIEDHVMHHERYAIPPGTVQAIADCRPSCLRRSGYRGSAGRIRVLSRIPGTNPGYPAGSASSAPETGSSAAGGWGFRRSGRRSGGGWAGHRRRSRLPGRSRAGTWPGGRCRRRLPCPAAGR